MKMEANRKAGLAVVMPDETDLTGDREGPSNPAPGWDAAEETQNSALKGHEGPPAHCRIIYSSRDVEGTRMSVNGRRRGAACVQGTIARPCKNETLHLDSMEGPAGCGAEWRRLGRERCHRRTLENGISKRQTQTRGHRAFRWLPDGRDCVAAPWWGRGVSVGDAAGSAASTVWHRAAAGPGRAVAACAAPASERRAVPPKLVQYCTSTIIDTIFLKRLKEISLPGGARLGSVRRRVGALTVGGARLEDGAPRG